MNLKNSIVVLLVLGIIFLFINGYIASVFIGISFIFGLFNSFEKYNSKLDKKFDKKKEEAREYIEKIKANNSLPTIISSMFLDKDEHAFLEEEVSLSETRSVRHNSGGGAGVRVMKGVTIGGYSGKSSSTQEWKVLDTGKVILTNKQLIFQGEKENRQIPLKKIFGFDLMVDGISVSSGKKNIMVSVDNPYIWGVGMNIVKKSDNPTSLSETDSDIEIL